MTVTDKAYWNGQPTKARRVIVKVGTCEKETYWYHGLEGTERKAVEVTHDDYSFFLDDEDGGGWLKVTLGRGGPDYGHSGLPQDSKVLREREGV